MIYERPFHAQGVRERATMAIHHATCQRASRSMRRRGVSLTTRAQGAPIAMAGRSQGAGSGVRRDGHHDQSMPPPPPPPLLPCRCSPSLALRARLVWGPPWEKSQTREVRYVRAGANVPRNGPVADHRWSVFASPTHRPRKDVRMDPGPGRPGKGPARAATDWPEGLPPSRATFGHVLRIEGYSWDAWRAGSC